MWRHSFELFCLFCKIDIHYQTIMRRSDVLKIVFVCVCVCHMCPAHPCGDNPLMLVDNFSRTRGFDPETMLAYMRERAPNDYHQLMADYRVYLECTQMVHTGYFKRSVDSQEDYDTIGSKHLDNVDKQFMDRFGETVKQLFGSRQQMRYLSRNNFKTRSETNHENLDNQLVNRDDLPFIIKRLLGSKLSTTNRKRNRRLHAKHVMDV